MKVLTSKVYWVLSLFVIVISHTISGQEFLDNSTDQSKYYWKASWIAHPTAPYHDYGVFHFRRHFTMSAIPDSLPLYVSADQRYVLYLNGEEISFGPARGDLLNWRYECINIAPFIKQGDNVLAAQVYHLGREAPAAQMTLQSGFICQIGEATTSTIFTGDGQWKVMANTAYSPIPYRNQVRGYYAAGPGDRIDASAYPWGWQDMSYDDSDWLRPSRIDYGKGHGATLNASWVLVPRQIPPLEKTRERLQQIRRYDGISEISNFISGSAPLSIPPYSQVSILLDRNFETAGFPVMKVSGGKGAEIKVTYSESLYDSAGLKGNRDQIEGKKILGYHDVFLPDGQVDRVFRTLWWRTFRYIQLDITTADTPLEILDYYSDRRLYPFQLEADFSLDDNRYQELWQMCWRTSRLCAFETYMDCPYFEQLNYPGDTRIQALISLYLTGDDRLMKDAIQLFEQSRTPFGITQGRYPTRTMLFIPTYSLVHITMIHDYYMHRQDHDFIRPLLRGVRSTLEYYEDFIQQNGLLGHLKWWQFVDWSEQFVRGAPPGVYESTTANISLQFIYTVQRAAELFSAFGWSAEAEKWKLIAENMQQAIRKRCYDSNKKLFSETPAKKEFTQHTNIFAILTETADQGNQNQLLEQIINNQALHQTTLYYKYYLFEALRKCGRGDLFEEELAIWFSMIDRGYSTCGETGEAHHDRSDCHAWSASPALFFLSLMAGITSDAPGFREIRVRPFLGDRSTLRGSMPHPDGEISWQYQKIADNQLQVEIILPESVTGDFHWNGESKLLVGGKNEFTL